MQNKKLGIIGGMGPLASSEFLGTLYRRNMKQVEQDSVDVIMYSITSVPDRTGSILENSEQAFIDRLIENCTQINNQGVDKIIICCFTSHYFLDAIPLPVRNKIISLVDIAHELVIESAKPSLLLASKGSYLKKIFSTGSNHHVAAAHVVVPEQADQDLVHELIYGTLKRGGDAIPVIAKIEELMKKYNAASCIAGCTEFHLLHRSLEATKSTLKVIDPLQAVSIRLKHYMEIRPIIIAADN